MEQYWTNFDTRSCAHKKTPVLVIGSGVAGLQTAWSLAEKDQHVLVAARDTLADSNTAKAQGGIASALGPDDTPRLHLKDTLIAGAGLTDERIAEIVVTEGPHAVLALQANGAEYDLNPDGTLSLGREGAHCRNRIVHSHGDSTGAEVSRALRAIVATKENIETLEHCYITELLVRDGVCYGAMALYGGKPLFIEAGAVVLAAGGTGRLFYHTTNPEGAMGCGIALGYRAGAVVKDMEFVQFHPTALALPHTPSFLVSEAVRGAGALLYNVKGERFMPKYHPMKELAPRDVVARCIGREMKACDADHVLLDATVIPDVAEKFPMIAETLRGYGIDMAKQPIPIAPAAHYMMGGVASDEWGRTNVRHLYVCGENACTGLQGANRLASNSLLEGLVFGRRVAEDICRSAWAKLPEGVYWQSRLPAETLPAEEAAAMHEAVQKLMSRNMGIVRNQEDLEMALGKLQDLEEKMAGKTAATPAMLDLYSQLLVSRLMTQAALARKESRGGHYRLDYPETKEAWRHHSLQNAAEPGKVAYTE